MPASDGGGVLFVSTMASSGWGGSEELWSRAAVQLVERGLRVHACVNVLSRSHPRVRALEAHGVSLSAWSYALPLAVRVRRRLVGDRTPADAAFLSKLLARRRPALTVIAEGSAFPPIDLLETLQRSGAPFVTISQANFIYWGPDDALAERYRRTLAAAKRCYFVSKANLRLFEQQIGAELPNAEVVRNPFNVSYDARPPWPAVAPENELRMACVGRLHPASKGQDLAFEALAAPRWRERSWRLALYGDGPNRDSLVRMAQRLGLDERVQFMGHVGDIESVWADNHVLMLPSRYEGLPLSLIEAMLCGRPAITTDVAGHAEVVDDEESGFIAQSATTPALLEAMERAWTRRDQLRQIGETAALRIRERVPVDPIDIFVQKLVQQIGA